MISAEEARDYADYDTPQKAPSYDGVALVTGRAYHYRVCPTCQGSGSVTVNDTNPYGFGPDPQCDDDAPCPNPDCEDGNVIVWRDPLLRLRTHRLALRGWFHPRNEVNYGMARQDATSPVCLPGTSA